MNEKYKPITSMKEVPERFHEPATGKGKEKMTHERIKKTDT